MIGFLTRLAGFVLVFIVLGSAVSLRAAIDLSPWLRAEAPTLTKITELSAGSSPETGTINSQIDCRQQKIVTKPGNFFSDRGIQLAQKEESIQGCVVDTKYGSVGNGYLLRPGTLLAGKVQKANGTPLGFYPIPNSDAALFLEPTGWNDGTVRATGIFPDFGQQIINTPFIDREGAIIYRLKSTAKSVPLAGPDGQPLILDSSTIGFSKNGEWMIADATMYGPVRINIATREVLRLNPEFRYYSSLYPESQSAITSDGRYVFTTSGLTGTFLLYDLSRCIALGANPPKCPAKDFRPFLLSQSPELKAGSYIRFSDENNITFYSSRVVNKQSLYTQYAMTAPGETLTKFGYLALGDSFASGEGTFSYKAGTDVREPLNKCHLSLLSYPYLLGSDLNLDSYQSVACSGAKMHDIDGYGFERYRDGDPQSEGKEPESYTPEILSGFLPGYRVQNDFIIKNKPGVITVSVLGNDIGFGPIISRCILTPTCYGDSTERADKVNEINSKFDQLVGTYQAVRDNAPPGAKIYALGYPQLAKADGNCGANVHANRQELEFFDKLIRYLNFVVERAALKAGVVYVNVEDALVGSRLCETDSSRIAVNGLTAGNDNFLDIGPVGKESFHPNTKAHGLYRDTILRETNNFTKKASSLVPNSPLTSPTLLDAAELIGDPALLARLRPYYLPVQKDDLAPDVVFKDQAIQASIDNLRPSSKLESFIKSEPVLLATTTVTADGSVNLALRIPSNIPPGLHTIHIYGSSVAGEPLDIYKDVYVAFSENDYDGDGVLNEQEKCLGVEPANQDYDEDDIDDACDPLIGEAPPPKPDPLPAPEEIVVGGPTDLPSFVAAPNKESQSRGETVAGNEPQLAAPVSEPVAQVAVASSESATQIRQAIILSSNQTASPSPQILGASSNTYPAVAAITASTLSPNGLADTTKRKSNSVIPYLLGILMALVVFGFVQRRRKI